MKKCVQCGTIQDNKYNYCIDCNAKLGEPLPKDFAENEPCPEPELKPNAPDETYYFIVTRSDKLKSFILLALAILHYILLRIKADILRERCLTLISLFAILYSIAFVINLLLPEISWGLIKLDLHKYLKNPDDIKPPDTKFSNRRRFSWLIIAIDAAALIILLLYSVIFSE